MQGNKLDMSSLYSRQAAVCIQYETHVQTKSIEQWILLMDTGGRVENVVQRWSILISISNSRTGTTSESATPLTLSLKF